ncbi:P-II family nitrogen regulator [Candidatus Desantisbacteria bacterium]|nr:P-II family nitrogen regulator [Candidatus Desantisbacteria bacterium]
MKEIMAIIRQDKINKTKEALIKANFPAMTVRKVLGRGAKPAEFNLIYDASGKAAGFSEVTRLMPKRLITIIVKDEQVEEITHSIIKTSQTGNIGDGKIFVLPVQDAYRVRDGKKGDEVI